MGLQLANKICIVTGATSGMGKAIAERFHAEGALLVLSGRDAQRGAALAQALDNAIFIAGDVKNMAYNTKLVDTALSAYGGLDIVSMNAGVLGLGQITEVTVESWHETLNTNLSALFYLSKAALPALSRNRGTIIINASIAAYKSFPNHPAYCASKAGAVALMKQMALDYAPEVRVNAICPGPVDTPLIWDSAKAFENPEIAVKNAAEATLMKRLGQPRDIANLALFLASQEASWITGTAMTIDGGILNS